MLATDFLTCSPETCEQKQGPPVHVSIYIWCIFTSAHRSPEMKPCELTAAEEPRGAGGGMGTEGSEACSAATGWGGEQGDRKADVSQLTNAEEGMACRVGTHQRRPESSPWRSMRKIAVFCSKPWFLMGQKHQLMFKGVVLGFGMCGLQQLFFYHVKSGEKKVVRPAPVRGN